MYLKSTDRRRSPGTKRSPGARSFLLLLAFGSTTLPTSAQQQPSVHATVSVDYRVSEGPLFHAERYNNFSSTGNWAAQRPADVAFYNAEGLHGKIYRVWVNDTGYTSAAGIADFADVAAYLRDASTISDSILVNLSPQQSIESGKPPDELKPIMKAMIEELKSHFPKIDYIEAFNEPDWGLAKTLKPEQLYPYYKAIYEAVGEVNRELRPKTPLKVGGPALMALDMPWLTAFLDGYKADTNPDKHLDFISYHAYGEFSDLKNMAGSFMFKNDPSRLAAQRGKLDAELRKRGLDPDIPSFITETGLYPGPSYDDPNDPHADAIRQAAGMASYDYWFMTSPKNIPFNWVLRHQTEERKDQLVTRAGRGVPVPTDIFTPYGNMMLMMSKMRTTRVSAVSDSLHDGLGVYALAAKGANGLSLMIWNYQGVHSTPFDVTINLAHLPGSLGKGRVEERTFTIDKSESNYFANRAKANLQMISDTTDTPDGKTLEKTIVLEPNAIELILIGKAKRK